MKLIPLLLDLEGRKITIFGGGQVGERKALLFQEYTENVTVISQDFTPKLKNSKAKLIEVKSLTDQEIQGFIRDSFIVVPATSDQALNSRITLAAHQAGKLVDTVDRPGDVVVPSIVKQGDIIIGISTTAKSPALTKYLRMKIEKTLTPSYTLMAQLQNELREQLKQELESQPARKEILWKVLEDPQVWDALETGDYQKALKLAARHLQKPD